MKAKVQKKRKKVSKKKKQQTKSLLYTVLVCGLVAGISYVIFATNILEPKIDGVTASYISFNNSNSTDMLKIVNLLKLNEDIGKSSLNNSKVDFNVAGNEDKEYQVVLYPTGNDINNKYVNALLSINKEKKVLDKLSNMETTEDGGIIVYQGTLLKENKIKIQMWIDNTYKEKIDNISYEIKIKSR